jgi:WD40 repeat protein
LTELWEQRDGRRLTLAAYVAAGGIRGAVARIAERAYGAVDPADQAAARILLLRLAGPGEGEAVTRRRVPLTELAALPDRRVRAVVDPLAQARLLSVSAGHVEVAHEALFREWPRLRAWLDEDAAGRAVQRRLAVAVAEWDAGGREPTELWRGTRLAAGVEFASAHPDEVTDVEHVFLEAGQAQLDAERREAEERAATATRQNRRLRWLLGGLGVVLALALVAGTLAVQAGSRAEHEARIATARELAAASVANLEADPELSVLLALQGIEHTRSVDGSVLPEAEEALHRAVVGSRIVLSVPGVGGALDWSPDGRLFVTEGPEETGVVDIRDAETGESVRSFPGHDRDVNDVAFSRDGSMLATTGDDGAVRVWDTATGKQLRTLQGPRDAVVWGPSFSPDGSLLAASWQDKGLVRVLDVATGRTVHEIGPLERPTSTSFSPDGKRLAMSVQPSVAVVVDVSSGEEVFTLRGHDRPVSDVEWSPDGRWIATSSVDLTARIWDAGTGHPRFTLSGHTGSVMVGKWRPDSRRLVTGSEDGTAKVWEITADATRELLSLSAQGTRSGVAGLAFSPDGDRVMTGEQAIKATMIWDVSVNGDAEWANLPADPNGMSGIAFTPDSRGVVASSGGGSVTVWNPETREKLRTIGSHGQREDPPSIHELDVSSDGRLMATATDGETKVWDTATGEEAFTVHPGGGPVDWSPNGELLATADEGVVEIVGRSGRKVAVLQEDAGFGVISVQFSPDGRLLATARVPTGRNDPTSYRVKIWDWERGKVVRTIAAGGEGISFDPAGTRIATADPLGSTEIWDVESGHKVATLAGRTGGFWDVAFDPDGSRVATASLDGTVRLWDAESGEQVLVLRGHTGGVFTVRFSADGSKLASTGADGTVRVWALILDDLIEIAKKGLTRALDDEECLQYLHVERCTQA